jgi:predicted nucleic acid-binding protein
MAASRRTCVVVTDATVLINLAHVDRLDLLGRLPSYMFVVPPEVEAEVVVAEQATALENAFAAGHIARLSFAGTAELQVYADLVGVFGRGESACLALAEVQGACVASDERGRFRRLAEQRLGPGHILNTPGIYVLALRAGLLSVEEADHDKQTLETRRFRMRFSSFRDVL